MTVLHRVFILPLLTQSFWFRRVIHIDLGLPEIFVFIVAFLSGVGFRAVLGLL